MTVRIAGCQMAAEHPGWPNTAYSEIISINMQ
jgi:hypothetical protein